MIRSFLIALLSLVSCTVLLYFLFITEETFPAFNHQLLNDGTSALQGGDEKGDFLLGVGKADITGPVVEINMMGYADMSQSGTGLRQRLYCRAFIVGSLTNPEERLVYLVLDTQSGDTAVRRGILEKISQMGQEYQMYTGMNIAVTGTHSHAGPGGWLNYLLPQITSKGFSKVSYEAIVNGSVLAIKRAHESIVPGHLSYGEGKTSGINVNRSPYAYLANPKHERDFYDADVDKTMTVLSFRRASDGLPLGILSWFPVHGTSLYQNNTLIAGDNKGVAAYLYEKSMQDNNPNFVAGFSQSNVGDTSPNTLGAYCEDTGFECRFNDSTCDGRTQGCHGRGPRFMHIDQGTRSCFEIGKLQFEASRNVLLARAMHRIPASPVTSFHKFANLSSYSFTSPFNSSQTLTTCSAALGHGFAGGTTDGPGAFDFKQGTNDSGDSPSLQNPLWRAARGFVHNPSDEQILCQHPKPILLDVGAAKKPYAWTPNIVNIQLMRVGPIIIIVSPGEATTMSGRRWRKAVAASAEQILGIPSPKVVIGGPANTYAHYIATEEEYSVQRYEGASTLYGPHTLAAFINLTVTDLPYLGSPEDVHHLKPLDPGPSPPINVNVSYSFINPVINDNAGLFQTFGQVLEQPDPSKTYQSGDLVSVKFIAANPRNNFRLEGTFAAVEKYDAATQTWSEIRTDRDWFLTFKWERISTILGTSEVTLEWEIEPETNTGLYRFRYYGDAKSITGPITEFTGTSDTFKVHAVKPQQYEWGGLIRS